MKKEVLKIWLFVLVVVVAPIMVFGVVKWYENQFQKLPFLGPEKHVVGDFKFKDQNDNLISKQTWKGKVVVANFFFTHCPIVCPKMVYQLKRVQAYSKDVIISSFSVDPKRDSVGRLKEYAHKFDISKNWFLITGDKKALYRFARKELFIVATDGDGGAEDFIHSENLVLIDEKSKIRGLYKGTDENEVNKLVQDIKKLQAEAD